MLATRAVLLFCFTVFVSIAIAQDSTFSITSIVKVDSVSRDELYSRGKNWVAATFVSPKKITETEDSANYTLVIKPAFLISLKGENGELPAGYIKYTLNLQCKDGRYKLSLTDFTHYPGESSFGTGGNLKNLKPKCGYFVMAKGVWFNIREKALDYAKHIQQSVIATMDTKPKAVVKEDW